MLSIVLSLFLIIKSQSAAHILQPSRFDRDCPGFSHSVPLSRILMKVSRIPNNFLALHFSEQIGCYGYEEKHISIFI